MKRLLAILLLLVGCASAPRIAEPLVLDFRWEPPAVETTTAFGRPEEIEREQEMLGLVIRNAFDTKFEKVTLARDLTAPVAAMVSITEFQRSPYATTRMQPSGGNTTVATDKRCGTVTYMAYSGGRDVSRGEFPLDCAATGRPDYQRAGLRAADEIARVVRPPAARTR